jgi:uncharacterized OsmC-like protein
VTNEKTMLNGFDVDEVGAAIDGVRQQPEAGLLTWRSRARWDGGFGLDVHTRAIEQMGQVIDRKFTLRGDHPPELLGRNTGPTAVEALLAALGSCVAGTFAAQATARGVSLDGLEIDIEGAIDLNGFFGLKEVSPGMQNVKLTLKIASDASEAELQEMLEATRRHSPVFDTFRRPITVEAMVRKVA